MLEICLPSLQQVHARHLSDVHVGILRYSTAQRFHQQLSLELLVLGVHFRLKCKFSQIFLPSNNDRLIVESSTEQHWNVLKCSGNLEVCFDSMKSKIMNENLDEIAQNFVIANFIAFLTCATLNHIPLRPSHIFAVSSLW